MHQENCNIAMAMYSIELVFKCQKTEKLKTKNEILELKRFFFDFRGMIMALLAFDNQKYCTFIDIVLSLNQYIFIDNKYYIVILLLIIVSS